MQEMLMATVRRDSWHLDAPEQHTLFHVGQEQVTGRVP
jgi:hypothetical protein